MKITLCLNNEELKNLNTPIVVEMWDKRLGGKIKKAWLAEFNELERKKASKLYRLFYNWYLIKGIPQSKTFKPDTLNFINRLVNFFATV